MELQDILDVEKAPAAHILPIFIDHKALHSGNRVAIDHVGGKQRNDFVGRQWKRRKAPRKKFGPSLLPDRAAQVPYGLMTEHIRRRDSDSILPRFMNELNHSERIATERHSSVFKPHPSPPPHPPPT